VGCALCGEVFEGREHEGCGRGYRGVREDLEARGRDMAAGEAGEEGCVVQVEGV